MLYLFYGDDDYTVRTQARAVEARYADPAGAFNVQRLDGATAPWNDLVSACRVLPFFTSHQVVRVTGLLGASLRRRARSGDDPTRAGASPETLTDLVTALPTTTVLVLEEGPLQATNAHVKALKALTLPKELHLCPLLEGGERVQWVRNEVTQRGGAIDSAAATMLAERLSGSLWALVNAIAVLVAYVGPGGRITTAAVEEMVVADEEANAFHLTDAIAARQAPRALTLVHRLLHEGMVPEQVMAMLTGRVRDWTLAAALRSEKVAESEAIARLGGNPGRYRAIARALTSFGRGELINAYQALVIADEALKSRPGDERTLILDLLVLTLCQRSDPEVLRQTFPVPQL